MRCKEFNRRLNEPGAWNGTGDSRREMDLHRSGCRRCAAVWQAERMLRAMVVPPAPPTLLERICAVIDAIAAGVVLPFPARRTVLIVGLTLAVATAAATLDWIGKIEELWRAEPEAVAEETAPVEAEASTEPEIAPEAPPDIEAPLERDVPLIPNVVLDWERIIRMPGGAPEPSQEGETGEAEVAALEPVIVAASETVVAADPDSLPSEPESEHEDESALAIVDAPMPPNAFDALIEIETVIAADERDRAAELARTLLAQVAAYFGDPSREMADTHFRLGELYRDADDLDAAIRHYEGGIQALTDTVHAQESQDTELMEPLVELGNLYQSMGYHGIAIVRFEMARNIGRRDDGLHNLDQIDILDRMSRSAVALGLIEDGRAYQLEMRRLVQLNFGANSLEAIAAHYRYADWIRSQFAPTRWPLEELTQVYTDARTIVYEHFLGQDPRQDLDLLLDYSANRLSGVIGWGRLDLLEPVKQALTEAGRIYESNGLDDPEIEARIAFLRGDLYVFFDAAPKMRWQEFQDWRSSTANGRPVSYVVGFTPLPEPYWWVGVPNSLSTDDIHRYVDQYYREAWDALGRLPNGDALRAEWFTPGTAVVASAASSHVVTTDPNAPWGSVEIAFEINSVGRVRRPEIIRSAPEGLFDKTAENRLSEMRFRPAIVDGRIVESSSRIVLEFQYDPAAATGRRAR